MELGAVGFQKSNGKHMGCLGYIGDCTMQLKHLYWWDHNKES